VRWGRIAIYIAIIALFLIGFFMLAIRYSAVVADFLGFTSVEITVTAQPLYISPDELLVRYVNDYEVEILWNKAASANNTMVRAKYHEYPQNIEDGYLVYCGQMSSCNDTAVNFYDYVGRVKYRAWSDNYTGEWQPQYKSGEVEGIAVIDLVEQITIFNDYFDNILPQVIFLLLVVIITVLAYWHKERLLYIFAGFAQMLYGFSYFSINTYISIVFVLLGIYSLIKAWLKRRSAE